MALEFYIKNLSGEIQQECKRNEIECHQNFMRYYLTLLAYDPLWNLHPKMKEIVRMDALRMINFVVSQMSQQHCPCIIALKMQFYFHCNYKSKQEIMEVEEYNFTTRLKPLIDEIVESKPETEEEYDMLFKQIIYYTALWRGLGNPTQELIYREMYHAMTSIMDNSDLLSFIETKQEEKCEYLLQFAQICTGVRIFNWTTKKGGEGIDDLPSMIADLVNDFKTELSQRLQKNMDKLDILTTAVDNIFMIDELELYGPDGEYIEYSQSCYIPDSVEYEEVEYYKDMIIVFREIEGFYRLLLESIEQIETKTDSLNDNFADCLERFHSLEHLKSGVPTALIFPLFIELDSIWNGFQHEICYAKKMTQIMLDLDLYIKDFFINYEKLEVLIDDKDIITDADRLEISEDDEPFSADLKNITIIQPDSKEFDLDAIALEFAGFDVWRMVESQGGLIPGNPYQGILVYEGKHYAFSCKQSAFMFGKYPQRLINEALELARKKVVLIPLLELEEDLAKVQTINQLVTDSKQTESNVAHSNTSIQTEIHPVESRIDPLYLWNIWDYKRQAVMLADMSKRATKGANTEESASSCHISTQTYIQKSATQQTNKDNYTNTHTPQTYFFGLRGRRDDKQFILDLTKPIDKS